ncbi:hypothetical protein pipiens_015265 [Culex pipiens pipiens]|uniref:Uncharacterized protein n=1 Tax=Culex pipiens pipiens TaxID=38569 RepID=A0ABD1CR71_CULPP
MLKRTARSEPHRTRGAGGPGGPRGDRDYRKRGPGEDRSRKAISVPELALLSSVVDLAADPSPDRDHLLKSVLSIAKKLESDPKTLLPPLLQLFHGGNPADTLRSHVANGRLPDFGSNDVYQVVLPPQTTMSGINPTDDVLNNLAMMSSAGDDCGTDHTSKVDDISANRTGSLDTIIKPGGCDCCDEEEDGFGGEPIEAVSKKNLLPEAAAADTSQRSITTSAVPESKNEHRACWST